VSRSEVEVGGNRYRFNYWHDTRRWRFNHDGTRHEGDAATLSEAKHHVRRIIRGDTPATPLTGTVAGQRYDGVSGSGPGPLAGVSRHSVQGKRADPRSVPGRTSSPQTRGVLHR
jgi:hypothetical protein